MFHTKSVEIIKNIFHVKQSNFFLENLVIYYNNVEKQITAEQATDDNMAHARGIQDS